MEWRSVLVAACVGLGCGPSVTLLDEGTSESADGGSTGVGTTGVVGTTVPGTTATTMAPTTSNDDNTDDDLDEGPIIEDFGLPPADRCGDGVLGPNLCLVPSDPVPFPIAPYWVATGDIDGDGSEDIVGVDGSTLSVSRLIDGEWTHDTIAKSTPFAELVVHDLFGVGRAQIVLRGDLGELIEWDGAGLSSMPLDVGLMGARYAAADTDAGPRLVAGDGTTLLVGEVLPGGMWVEEHATMFAAGSLMAGRFSSDRLGSIDVAGLGGLGVVGLLGIGGPEVFVATNLGENFMLHPPVAADIDADGALEVVKAGIDDIAILSVDEMTISYAGLGQYNQATAGDFDGTPGKDLALADVSVIDVFAGYDPDLEVFSLGYGPPPALEGFVQVTAGDFDGDGDDDLASVGDDAMVVYYNDP